MSSALIPYAGPRGEKKGGGGRGKEGHKGRYLRTKVLAGLIVLPQLDRTHQKNVSKCIQGEKKHRGILWGENGASIPFREEEKNKGGSEMMKVKGVNEEELTSSVSVLLLFPP